MDFGNMFVLNEIFRQIDRLAEAERRDCFYNDLVICKNISSKMLHSSFLAVHLPFLVFTLNGQVFSLSGNISLVYALFLTACFPLFIFQPSTINICHVHKVY